MARQDAFTDNFLKSQRGFVFPDVGVLIYVFDIESREFDRDLVTYNAIIKALHEFSPRAAVFCLIHKMDLVQADYRDRIYQERAGAIRAKSESFEQSMQTYASSIWDQSLYKAWGSIVHSLIPNLELLETYLKNLSNIISAEEIILFERTTFLTVTSYTSEAGSKNPYPDRYERLSNIIKTFKHSLAYIPSSLSYGERSLDQLTQACIGKTRLLRHLRINSPTLPLVLRASTSPSTVSPKTPMSYLSSHLVRSQRTARS